MNRRSIVVWGAAASVAICVVGTQAYLLNRLHQVTEELNSLKTERSNAVPANQPAGLAVKMLWSAIEDLGKSHNQLVEAHKSLVREVASDRIATSGKTDRAEAAASKALEPCIVHSIC